MVDKQTSNATIHIFQEFQIPDTEENTIIKDITLLDNKTYVARLVHQSPDFVM